MKKILALLLVLGIATSASATILDVRAANLWPGGDKTKAISNPTQAQLDAVGVGDRVNLKVVVIDNGIPVTYGEGVYAYDVNGYNLGVLSSNLKVTGPGNLAITGAALGFHPEMLLPGSDPVVSNEIVNIAGSGPFDPPEAIPGGAMSTASGAPWDQISTPAAFYGFNVTVTSTGTIIYVDLTNYTVASQYRVGGSGAWTDFVESDYGDLHMGIPEPMTIALLGLGGLGLIYRRRRA